VTFTFQSVACKGDVICGSLFARQKPGQKDGTARPRARLKVFVLADCIKRFSF